MVKKWGNFLNQIIFPSMSSMLGSTATSTDASFTRKTTIAMDFCKKYIWNNMFLENLISWKFQWRQLTSSTTHILWEWGMHRPNFHKSKLSAITNSILWNCMLMCLIVPLIGHTVWETLPIFSLQVSLFHPSTAWMIG